MTADHGLKRSLHLLLAASLACTPLAAQSDRGTESAGRPARQYLKKLAARSKDLRSLHVRFLQEKHLRILRRPRLSEGELWFSKGRLSMTIRREGSVESHLLMKDGELKILYPELKRLETLELASDGGERHRDPRMAIPFLAGDWEAAERDYEVSLRRDREDKGSSSGERVVLELVPRAATSPVKSLRMVFVDEQLREYSQEERSGNKVRMEIVSWEENGEIPAERFRLEVPPGTKTARLR